MVYRQTAIQLSFESFGTNLSTPLSADNEWVQLADQMPWKQLDEAYQLAFPSKLGRAGKPFRLLYGAQLIKQKTGLSDRDVVEAIRDTPAYQYFIGIPQYQLKLPFDHTALAYFRRRIAPISELIRGIITDTVRERLQSHLPTKSVMITDATCTPVNIKYPQDTQLLNSARTNLEGDIMVMAHQLQIAPPRTYKREAHAVWIAFSRKPRRWGKLTRKQIKAQLQYIHRDLRYMDEMIDQGADLTAARAKRLGVIRLLFDQQDYMYRNRTHRVEDRIVSLSQPEIRPIVRGKAKAPVEFGPKIDISIMDGVIDIERFSFSAFNESSDLGATLDHYFDVHGEYPDEVLLDTLYRTRKNIGMCANLGIRVSGPRLGRKPKHVDAAKRRKDQDAENRRGEIERRFAFVKGTLGLNLVKEKTAETIAVAVDTGVVMANLEHLLAILGGPISMTAQKDRTAVKIDYKVITDLPNSEG